MAGRGLSTVLRWQRHLFWAEAEASVFYSFRLLVYFTSHSNSSAGLACHSRYFVCVLLEIDRYTSNPKLVVLGRPFNINLLWHQSLIIHATLCVQMQCRCVYMCLWRLGINTSIFHYHSPPPTHNFYVCVCLSYVYHVHAFRVQKTVPVPLEL